MTKKDTPTATPAGAAAAAGLINQDAVNVGYVPPGAAAAADTAPAPADEPPADEPAAEAKA